MDMQKAKTIIQQHYGLKKPVTNEEVRQELESLKRKGPLNWDDNQFKLAMKLEWD